MAIFCGTWTLQRNLPPRALGGKLFGAARLGLAATKNLPPMAPGGDFLRYLDLANSVWDQVDG